MCTDAETRRLLKAMRRIARAMDVHSSRIHRAVGLTLPQFIVLDCVRDLGEVTSRTISHEAGLSPPTVVGILDKLAMKGLVERYRSVTDRRVVHTRLTAAGEVTLENAPPLLGERIMDALDRMEAADRNVLITAIEMAAALQEPDVQLPDAVGKGDVPQAYDMSTTGEQLTAKE